MRARILASSLLAAGFAVSLPARAERPPTGVLRPGDGTIALMGGGRIIPQHGFVSQQQRDGLSPVYTPVQPTGVASLGYQIDEMLHVAIDFSYANEITGLTGGDASARSFGLLIALDGTLFARHWISLYAGGGLGYSLNTFGRAGQDTESNSTAGMVKAGARIRLTEKLALVLENRYVLSSAYWPLLNSGVNVGGYTFTAGLLLHFFSGGDRHEMGR